MDPAVGGRALGLVGRGIGVGLVKVIGDAATITTGIIAVMLVAVKL